MVEAKLLPNRSDMGTNWRKHSSIVKSSLMYRAHNVSCSRHDISVVASANTEKILIC